MTLTAQQIVARTLNQLSWWSDDERTPRELRRLAGQVADDDHYMSCPLCQEVTCDEDCPLQGERGEGW